MNDFISFSFLFILCLSLLSIGTAQERAPHGLVYVTPEAFSPSAYNFFHPNERKPDDETKKDSCISSKCSSPLPIAAQVEEAAQIHETKDSSTLDNGNRKHQLGAGGVAGIVFGVAFVVIIAMGVYHIRVTRRANIRKANSTVKLDA